MDKESDPPKDKPSLPPPSLPKPAPPPTPPASTPPPPPASSEPPLKVAVTPGSTEDDHDPELIPEPVGEVPGSDASMPNRVIATFIDGVIAGGLNLGFIMLPIPFIGALLGWAAALGYLILRDSLPFLEGQSVGKKAMGIVAVTTDGESLAGNWQPGIIRNLGLAIPLFAFVELFVLIKRQDGPKPLLRLGDEWGKTKVIVAGDAKAAENGGEDGAAKSEGEEPKESDES